MVKIIISLFLLVCLVFWTESSYAQNKVSKDFTLIKTLKQDGLEYQFTVLSSDKRGVGQYDIDRTYFWYKAQKIMGTEGGASGTLLQGDFVAYHSNKQLAQQGKFCKGLKSGIWCYWNDEGKIVKVEKWRRGKEVLPKVKEEKGEKSFWRLKKLKADDEAKDNKRESKSKKEKKKDSEGKRKLGSKIKELFLKKDKSDKKPVKADSKKKSNSNDKE